MILARVIGKVISTDKHPAYQGKPLLMVQKLNLDNQPLGNSTIAIDYVGAGEGDTVLVGAAPGLASRVFQIPPSPLRELIMAIVDRVDSPRHESFGLDVPPGSINQPAEQTAPKRQGRKKSAGDE